MLIKKVAELRLFPTGQKVECLADYGTRIQYENDWYGPLDTFHPEWYSRVPKKGERFHVREFEEDPKMADVPGIVLRFDEIEGAWSRRQGFEVGFWSIYFAPVHFVRRQ